MRNTGRIYAKKVKADGYIFDSEYEQEDLGLHTRFGYGTKFDGDSIDLDICCDCFDKLMDKFIPMCKINPITEMD